MPSDSNEPTPAGALTRPPDGYLPDDRPPLPAEGHSTAVIGLTTADLSEFTTTIRKANGGAPITLGVLANLLTSAQREGFPPDAPVKFATGAKKSTWHEAVGVQVEQ